MCNSSGSDPVRRGMTTQVAGHPAMQLRRDRLRPARPISGVEAAVPDISFVAPRGQSLGDFARQHALD